MDRRKFISSLIGIVAATAIPANKLLSDRVQINKNITLNFKTKKIELHGKINLLDQLKFLSEINSNVVSKDDDKTLVKWGIVICSDCNATLIQYKPIIYDSDTTPPIPIPRSKTNFLNQ
jgi:hypothetical protein